VGLSEPLKFIKF